MMQFLPDSHSISVSRPCALSPAARTAAAGIFILAVVLTDPSSFLAFGLYGAMLLALVMVSGAPAGALFSRSLVVLPFVAFVGVSVPFFQGETVLWSWSWAGVQVKVTMEGLLILWGAFIKAYLSTLAMLLLLCLTPVPVLMKALERLHVPRLLVMILSFMLRYVHVLAGELGKMLRGRACRSPRARLALDITALSGIAGVLFLRSYEKGEMVHAAMCARGFTGAIQTLDDAAGAPGDLIFILILACALGGVLLLA